MLDLDLVDLPVAGLLQRLFGDCSQKTHRYCGVGQNLKREVLLLLLLLLLLLVPSVPHQPHSAARGAQAPCAMDFQFKRGHKKSRTDNRRRSLFRTPPKLREQAGEGVVANEPARPPGPTTAPANMCVLCLLRAAQSALKRTDD